MNRLLKRRTEYEECTLEEEVEMDGFKVVRAAKTVYQRPFPRKKVTFSYFRPFDGTSRGRVNEDESYDQGQNKETLVQFKVIELGEVHTGPVITRYDVHPGSWGKSGKDRKS